MKLALVVVVLAGLVLVALPPAPASGPLAFSSPVYIDGLEASGEPGVKVSELGHIYINSLSTLHDVIHLSVDGGTTFVPIRTANAVFGGGDDALALDRFGGVYLAGQYRYQSRGCQSMSTSLDAGATWFTTLAPCDSSVTGPLGTPSDRPWVAVYRPDVTSIPVVLLAHHAPCCGGAHWAVRSTDGGLTYEVAGRMTSNGWFPGNLIVDEPRGLFYYFTAECCFSAHAYRSEDLGSTWSNAGVAWQGSGTGLQRVTGAVDRAGNVYMVWSEDRGTGLHVYMSRSTDRATSWSTPVRVSTTTGTHIMPWIVAGDAGRVDVAWYETSRVGDPNSPSGMSGALWDVKFAQSLNALAPTPTWQEVKVTPLPHHRGVLCTGGLWCNQNNLNRNLLDFFEVAVDPSGNAVLVWAQDLNAPSTGTGPRLITLVDAFARQTGGESLYAS